MQRNVGLFVAISGLSGLVGGVLSLVPGIWILDLTDSSSLAALAQLCLYAPVWGAPWLGGLLDRTPRRPLLIGVNLSLALALSCLFAVQGPHQIWLIFAVLFAFGVSRTLVDAGETALLPAALSAGQLGSVNGWRSSAREGMKLVAPLTGIGLYAGQGGRAVGVLGVVPVLVAALYAGLWLAPEPLERTRDRQRIPRARLAVLLGRTGILVPVSLASVSIAMSGFTTAGYYAMVTTELNLPATFLGVLAGVQGLGSILGGLIVGRLITRRGTAAVGIAGTALFAVGCLGRCLPWSPAMFGASVAVGVGLPWTLVAAVTATQRYTPAGVLGRASGLVNMAMFGPVALAIPLGAGAVQLGSTVPLSAAAGVCLAAAAIASYRPRSCAVRRAAPGEPTPTRVSVTRAARSPASSRNGSATDLEQPAPTATSGQ
ncbi:MFS transporter [Salinispora sp. H7-4]|uniref:MFS transporter n=1 Tax=Salinispora sp. H7-4 TaxID=2748321 RepID=UPI0015D30D45|nr:MFS transporter [Salinispora sp. H7-4]NYT94557.1 MFS transporter [Salinispora sp. H7-4]